MTSNSPGDLHMDADPGMPTDGYKLLVKVDEELSMEDLAALKFLCQDVISRSKLEKVTRGIKLFEELKNCSKIVPEDEEFSFLVECLFRIHRLDLVRKLKQNPKYVRQRLKDGVMGSLLMPFRVMLFEVGEDISTEEFKSLTFLLSTEIPRALLQKMKSVFDLFIYLEKNEILTHEDVEILIRVLKDVDRGDLKTKVEEYKNSMEGRLPDQFPPRVSPVNSSNHIHPGQNRVPNAGIGNPGINRGLNGGLPSSGTEHPELHRAPSAGTVSNVSMELEPTNQRKAQLSEGKLFHVCTKLVTYQNWRDLGIEIGLTEENMNEFVQNNSESGLQALHMLKFWRDEIMKRNSNHVEILKTELYNLGFDLAAKELENGPQAIPRQNTDPSSEPMESENTEPPAVIHIGDMRHPQGQQRTNLGGNYRREDNFRSVEDRAAENLSVSQNEAQISMQRDTKNDLLRQACLPETSIRQVSVISPDPPVKPRLDQVFPPQRFDQQTQSSLSAFQHPAVSPQPPRQDELEGLMNRTYLDDEMDLPSYKMDSRPRGICIIINNENFFKLEGDPESKDMPGRTGTHYDADKLSYIFQKLDFIIERRDNLEDFEMARFLVEVSLNRDHRNYDCLVCCILSHGALGHVYGTNGRLVRIQTLTACFQSQKCPSLAGKPKLFFIQACQGREKQRGLDVETDAAVVRGHNGNDTETDEGGREMIPDEADFVLGYATVPGYVSYRSRSQGSWYINKLVEMLDKYAYRYDLMSILVKVNEEVGRANANIDGGRFKQIPAPLVTLRKKLFFR